MHSSKTEASPLEILLQSKFNVRGDPHIVGGQRAADTHASLIITNSGISAVNLCKQCALFYWK